MFWHRHIDHIDQTRCETVISKRNQTFTSYHGQLRQITNAFSVYIFACILTKFKFLFHPKSSQKDCHCLHYLFSRVQPRNDDTFDKRPLNCNDSGHLHFSMVIQYGTLRIFNNLKNTKCYKMCINCKQKN